MSENLDFRDFQALDDTNQPFKDNGVYCRLRKNRKSKQNG